MMKSWLLLLLILPISSLAGVAVDLRFDQTEVKQGDIVTATMQVAPESMNQINLQKLKGNNFAKTLFLYDFSPWLHSNGIFTANAKVIFTDVPQGAIIKDTINNQEIEIRLSQVSVSPTEAAPQLLFGTFEIPSPIKILKWSLGLIAMVAVGLLGWKIYRKQAAKRQLKQQKIKLKDEISSAQDYEGVVNIWQKKHQYLRTFPQLEVPFKNLEQVLFKYQFKPSQQAFEKAEVVEAYKKFLTESQEGFRGI